jgi:cell division initiation protein
MFDRPAAQQPIPSPESGSARPERITKVMPLDFRQQRFKTAFRGYDRTEVVAFLTEAADDYEQALRELDRFRQDLTRVEALLTEHRDRDANLRNTLMTAQKLADDIREHAQTEARTIVREAEARSDLLLQKAQARLDDIEREINELRLRRRDVEATLEASMASLGHALEFIRSQGRQSDDKLLLHRPRHADAPAAPRPGDAREASR